MLIANPLRLEGGTELIPTSPEMEDNHPTSQRGDSITSEADVEGILRSSMSSSPNAEVSVRGVPSLSCSFCSPSVDLCIMQSTMFDGLETQANKPTQMESDVISSLAPDLPQSDTVPEMASSGPVNGRRVLITLRPELIGHPKRADPPIFNLCNM